MESLFPHPLRFFYGVRKAQSILWAELEEFVSLLIKNYIGGIDHPNTVLGLGLESIRKSTSLLWTYQCCLNKPQTYTASLLFFFSSGVPTRRQNISCLERQGQSCLNTNWIWLLNTEEVLNSLVFHRVLCLSSYPHKFYSFIFKRIWWEWTDIIIIVPQESRRKLLFP